MHICTPCASGKDHGPATPPIIEGPHPYTNHTLHTSYNQPQPTPQAQQGSSRYLPYNYSSHHGSSSSSVPILDWRWAPAAAVAAMLCFMYRGKVEIKEPHLAAQVTRLALHYCIVPLYAQAAACVEVGGGWGWCGQSTALPGSRHVTQTCATCSWCHALAHQTAATCMRYKHGSPSVSASL